jgi:hypothetical protein
VWLFVSRLERFGQVDKIDKMNHTSPCKDAYVFSLCPRVVLCRHLMDLPGFTCDTGLRTNSLQLRKEWKI